MAIRFLTTTTVSLLAALLLFPTILVSSDGSGFCNMTQKGIVACKPVMTIGADPAMPVADDCCTALRVANIPCLCAQRSNPMIKYFGIDPNLALSIPSRCNIGSSADLCKGLKP
ncbi:Bifunctional inhibitor/lipid-transfer protein/seed storage 2S albumin protein [Dioscorea alata]|uniref:Bifunctional inhibitor/lipid-transfer protein/seed storage 2S albumin protein n=1 Tax=Dioscorea alata TaxID=55571 RepID=A0ACB7VAA3_DIOAL|nr:Bifunctional inhibitor/lipid-transfer protein/seed storage 2S albumin protein [Dioscorea alata]